MFGNSRVEQDISLARFAHSRDIMVNTRNKFNISAHPCITPYILLATYLLHGEQVKLNFLKTSYETSLADTIPSTKLQLESLSSSKYLQFLNILLFTLLILLISD